MQHCYLARHLEATEILLPQEDGADNAYQRALHTVPLESNGAARHKVHGLYRDEQKDHAKLSTAWRNYRASYDLLAYNYTVLCMVFTCKHEHAHAPFQYFSVVAILLGVHCISLGSLMLQRRASKTDVCEPMYHNFQG